MLALRCTDFGIIKRYGKIKRFTCAFVVPQTECGTEGPLPYQHIWSHLRLNHASSPACEPLHQSQRSPRNHTFFHEFHNPHRSDIYDRTAALLHHLWQVQFLLARTAEVLLGHHVCHIIAETSTHLSAETVEGIVHRIAGNLALDYTEVAQDVHLSDNQRDGFRCGDNGIFKGMCITSEQQELSGIARSIYEKYPTDGKYILDGDRLILCQSNAPAEELRALFPNAEVNPLGDWTGGTDAFYKCSSLTGISLPSVESVGVCAFLSCTKLTSVSILAISFTMTQ